MTVQRYRVGRWGMAEDAEGEWVGFEDFEAVERERDELRREVERLRKQRDHARDAIRQAGDALHFDQDQRAAFDALVRGLYAEEALGGDQP